MYVSFVSSFGCTFCSLGNYKISKLDFDSPCFSEHKRAKIVPKKIKLIEIIINQTDDECVYFDESNLKG